MQSIEYKFNENISEEEFLNLLYASSLAERRPVHDKECISGMLNNSNLIISARDNGKLIGIARSVTDFHYCCYLSDIAVDLDYQNKGIGKELINQTKKKCNSLCKIILLSAPKAVNYYPKIGFKKHPQCWVLSQDK